MYVERLLEGRPDPGQGHGTYLGLPRRRPVEHEELIRRGGVKPGNKLPPRC